MDRRMFGVERETRCKVSKGPSSGTRSHHGHGGDLRVGTSLEYYLKSVILDSWSNRTKIFFQIFRS